MTSREFREEFLWEWRVISGVIVAAIAGVRLDHADSLLDVPVWILLFSLGVLQTISGLLTKA